MHENPAPSAATDTQFGMNLSSWCLKTSALYSEHWGGHWLRQGTHHETAFFGQLSLGSHLGTNHKQIYYIYIYKKKVGNVNQKWSTKVSQRIKKRLFCEGSTFDLAFVSLMSEESYPNMHCFQTTDGNVSQPDCVCQAHVVHSGLPRPSHWLAMGVHPQFSGAVRSLGNSLPSQEPSSKSSGPKDSPASVGTMWSPNWKRMVNDLVHPPCQNRKSTRVSWGGASL